MIFCKKFFSLAFQILVLLLLDYSLLQFDWSAGQSAVIYTLRGARKRHHYARGPAWARQPKRYIISM